jgi:hypothetical protein
MRSEARDASCASLLIKLAKDEENATKSYNPFQQRSGSVRALSLPE